MNILQLRGEFQDNGPGTQALTIAKELRERGHEVIFCSSGGSLTKIIEDNNFVYHKIEELSLEKRNIPNVLKGIKKLTSLFKKYDVDIVHSHNAATVFIAYFAAKLAGKNAKVRYFQSCRGLELRKGYGWRNWVYLIHPGKVFAVSDYTKKFLLKIGMKDYKVITTYNGVDLNRFDISKVDEYREEIRKELDIPMNALVIGIIGKMGFKGHDLLIRAMEKLYEKHPKLYMVLVGSGEPYDEFVALSEELGVTERTIFTGLRFDSERLNAAFDIFALPSKWGEMFPNAILESMAYAHPFVSSRLSGIPEMAQDGEGLICEINDVEDLTMKIDSLLSNPEQRQKMGKAARNTLENKFTIEKVVDRIESSYINAF